MKTRNADLTAFEKSPQQQAYEQAVGQWSQTAQEVAKAGGTFQSPQPTPDQYGYTPGAPTAQQGSAPTPSSQSTGPRT